LRKIFWKGKETGTRVRLFDYFEDFSDGDCSAFVSQSEAAELSLELEWFHAAHIAG
jgi:hypothetical protein